MTYKGNTFYFKLWVGQHFKANTSLSSYSILFYVQVFRVSTINTNILSLLAAKCEKSKCRIGSSGAYQMLWDLGFLNSPAEITVVFEDHAVPGDMALQAVVPLLANSKRKG